MVTSERTLLLTTNILKVKTSKLLNVLICFEFIEALYDELILIFDILLLN